MLPDFYRKWLPKLRSAWKWISMVRKIWMHFAYEAFKGVAVDLTLIYTQIVAR